MKIHEYQAKEILREFNVPVPKGRVATTPAEAQQVAEELGGRVVVKAQIHAGGRGKGGGVKLADTPEAAEHAAGQILGMMLKTHQTGPEGQKVKTVLVEEASPIAQELYLGIVLDRETSLPVIMASQAGGMDIEEVAATAPEQLLKIWIDPTTNFQPYQGRDLAYGMGLSGAVARQAASLIGNLYKVFVAKDCSIAEINPLVVTQDERVIALDAKLNFDDNALYRHPQVVALRDLDEEAPSEVEASKYNLSFVKLAGTVGCMVNGAGLAMATMDIIKLAGGEPANFLDVGGGATAERVAAAFKIILADPKVRAILVNIFGGIARGDVIATGIVSASREVQLDRPLVVRLVGTNMEEGMRILKESGLNIAVSEDLSQAVRMAVAAAR